MMRALLDINIILDALLAREPFGAQAAALWEAHEDGRYTGYLNAITPAIVFYIARKNLQRKQAFRMVQDILETFEVSSVNQGVLRTALQLDIEDFEDAIQVASALADGLDCIVTRNLKDFEKSPIQIFSPVEFLKRLGKAQS
jgi:predicted nucleic acid-binding protein